MKSTRMLFIICLTLAATLLAPAVADARGAARTGRGIPPRISIDATLICLGERGATAEITVTNNGRQPVTLGELEVIVEFDGPGDLGAGLSFAILLIPVELEPGETFTYTLPFTDELLPPDPWASFHGRGSLAAQAWFAGFPRPVVQQLGPLGCR